MVLVRLLSHVQVLETPKFELLALFKEFSKRGEEGRKFKAVRLQALPCPPIHFEDPVLDFIF